MIGIVWRFFLAVFDWRTLLRKLQGKPVIDVAFITNMRDETDRKRFLDGTNPPYGNFDAARYHLDGVIGRVIFINSITSDLLTIKGSKEAKKQFISATKRAEEMGAKVILLAAGTKRLFGRSGEEIKNLFPNLLFTIGDNGTAAILEMEVLNALAKAELNQFNSRIAVLGPYGILGEAIVESLTNKGYKIVGAGQNIKALKNLATKYGIGYCKNFNEMGEVDAVIACTHSDKIKLTANVVKNIIRVENKKLLVIDVSEPANFDFVEYADSKNFAIRQDAGNAYSPKLKYVLGAISYRLGRLTRGVTFGCFGESLCLAGALGRGEKIKKIDWFKVNTDNMAKVKRLFKEHSFTTPSPRCFSKPINSFILDLDIGQNQNIGKRVFVLRPILEKLHII